MTIAESNEKLVERVSVETYTEGNADAIDELVSEAYVLHDPMSPEPIRGREGLKDHVESLREAAPDLSATIEHVIADDEFVAVHFTIRGTQEGPVPDLEPTGEPFEVVGMEFDRFARLLEYKAEEYGILVDRVDEENTSKTCSCCGQIRDANRVARGLYVCESCETVMNADVNGAVNIRRKITQSPPTGDMSNGWLAQPGVFLFDRESGRFTPREQGVCKP